MVSIFHLWVDFGWGRCGALAHHHRHSLDEKVMTYSLDEKIILDAMVDELDRQFKRFNREILIQYIAMKVPLTKKGINPVRAPQTKTTITHDTLKYWVKCFLVKYQ